MFERSEPNKVLIIESDAVSRKTIKTTLIKSGFECSEVKKPSFTLEDLKKDQPDLIVLEYLTNGYSDDDPVIAITRELPRTALVVSSAFGDLNSIVACMKFGAHDYLIKPFTAGDVLSCANRAIDKKSIESKILEYKQQTVVASKDQQSNTRLLSLHAIEGLIHRLEANDRYTNGHSRRVTKYAMAIGRELGLTQEQLDNLYWASLLHDVGKITLNPAYQNKPGPLTPDEYRYIMTHAVIGVGIVQPLVNQEIVDIILGHHYHFDGTGFGQTKQEDEIPIGARILALSDSFDAMVSDRAYRRALSIQEALTEVIRCSGSQFDPMVTKAFLRVSRYLQDG